MPSETPPAGGRCSAWPTLLGIVFTGTTVLWLIIFGGKVLFLHAQLESEWDDVTAPIEQLGGTVAWWTEYDVAEVKNAGEIAAAVTLRNSQANDEDVRYIATTFPKLYGLHLDGTEVTDQGLAHLHHMSSLTRVTLNNTSVTQRGVQELQTALPDCVIECRNPLPNQ